MIRLQMSRPTKSLIILSVLSAFLLGLRVLKSENALGFGLAWNLFLAWIPLGFALIARRVNSQKYKIQTGALMALWLLFFPNSTYIITDLMHLEHLDKHLLWYDSVGIFVTALTGLLLGLYSLLVVHEVLDRFVSAKISWVIISFCVGLSGFGVYLGRFIRFNSWDLFTQPIYLLRSIKNQLTNPFALKTTAIFAIVTLVLYVAFIIVLPSRTIQNEYSKNA